MKVKATALVLAALATAATFGEVFEGLEYYTTGEVEPGVWNTQYDKCVEKALSENIPMVVFWGRKGCGMCKKLDRANGEEKVIAWRKERGYIFLYGIEGEGDSSRTLKLAQKGGSLPFVGFYWGDQNGDGVLDKKDVLWCGCGRNGKMEVKDGSLAEQFMASAEKHFHDYQGNADYKGGHFAATGSAFDRLEYDGSSDTTYVKLLRDPGSKAGSTVLALYGADGKERSTNVVSWAEGQTEAEVEVDLSAVPAAKAAGDDVFATLYLVDEKGGKRVTNTIYRVANENSCGNPDFEGCGEFGRWTMDLAAATNLVAATEANAYTLVSIQGSLWCPDCANTERNFLDMTNAAGQNAFCEWAKARNVALVSVDIPAYSAQHLGLVDENGRKINDPYMSYASYDDVESPCLLSTRGFSTRLARPEEYPASGADAQLTNYLVRSGSPYLSRKGVSEAEARAVWERNWNLAWRNTEEGGFHRPEDGNKNRTGVPIFVLLRKDGTVAARFTDFASKSPMKDAANFEKFIPYFEQLLEIAKEGGEHADPTEIENNYPSAANGLIAPTNGVAVESELSGVDRQDAIRLGFVNGNARVKVQVTGLPPDGLTLTPYCRTADGVVTAGASVIKSTETTVDLAGVGEQYVMVAHNALTNGEFAAYGFTATVESLDPDSSRTEYSAPQGTNLVKVALVEGETYRIGGIGDNASLFEPVEGKGGFYTVKPGKGGEQAVMLAEAGGTLVIQRWQPGNVGFSTGETIVHEGDCPVDGFECVIKVSRYEGLSGWVKAGVEIDPGATTLSPLRYELLTTNLVWNDDGVAEKEVRLIVYPDDLFDGFDREITLRLTNLECEDGPTKATVGTAAHLVYIENDDLWVICQNMRVDGSYEIPLSQNVEFKIKRTSGSLPSGIKIAVDGDAGTKCLVVSGSTKALGLFEAVYEVTAKLTGGGEFKKDFKINGIVINPAVDGIGPDDPPYNASCVDARTYANVMLTGSNTASVAELPDGFGRLCGVLKLTIAKGAAKMSAKYTCAEGSVSFSSSKTGVRTDESTHAFVAKMKSTSKKFADYELTVEALPDGSVDLVLTNGETAYTGSVSGAPWSKANPAARWAGYYTVAFRPIGTVSNGVTAAGAPSTGRPYLTLKMESASQLNKGSMKWAGLLPNGKSVSGSSVLVRGDVVGDEPMVYLPAFKKSGSEVFAGLMRIAADAKGCKGEGSVFLPDPFGTDVYSVWTHAEKNSPEYSFEQVYRPYGTIYDHTMDDLQCCCADKYGLQATNMAFNVAVSAAFPASAKYGPLLRSEGKPVVGPFEVQVEPDSIALTGDERAQDCDAKLKFSRKTGVVSGTFLVPFEGGDVKATYRGVVLLGFGDPCGCNLDPDEVMPFVNGSWYVSDKVTDSTGKTISCKRGGAITVDAK